MITSISLKYLRFLLIGSRLLNKKMDSWPCLSDFNRTVLICTIQKIFFLAKASNMLGCMKWLARKITTERKLSPVCSKISALPCTATQSFYPSQYLCKQPFFYRNIRHLKRDISAVPYNFCSNLDELDEKAAK